MDTLHLTSDNWDLTLDPQGNLSILSSKAATLQDVASALRVWSGECWYNTNLGLPYDTNLFTGSYPIEIYQELAEEEAITVPNVLNCHIYLNQPTAQRLLTGNAIITFNDESKDYVSF